MRVKGWSGRSGLAKVDLYTRGTLYLIVWIAAIGLALMMLSHPVRVEGPGVLAVAGPLLALVVGLLCARLTRHGMDVYLRRARASRRQVGWAAGVTALTTGVVLTLSSMKVITEEHGLLAGMLMASLAPFLAAYSLFVSNRVTALVQLSVLAVMCALLLVTGHRTGEVAAVTITIGLVNGWMAFTGRASMWILGVMWQLREARDVEARLAVAEERLRFGRDLHDVLGRNLAVIALKSELAVQLARRGRAEAVDQMSEVQRIAQESQREVRDVVRGYREADLRVELAGARGVLDAAGINCTVVEGALELPGDVQSALAWVVREATTNVLRHGDARRCTISVGLADGGAVLVVENDGADDGARASTASPSSALTGASASSGASGRGGESARRPGSGLTGLRERLSAVHGTLEAGPGRKGHYRLTARVPLDGHPGQPPHPEQTPQTPQTQRTPASAVWTPEPVEAESAPEEAAAPPTGQGSVQEPAGTAASVEAAGSAADSVAVPVEAAGSAAAPREAAGSGDRALREAG
ncbi:sensor histidine kinase [Streptomyces albipurpureus]|uniref:Histidine kinase n=1 Tax=Streptomyces albipurpureus TaxID=2897419 RepID=A0ABT0USK3_9ACTN|nr:histidine kinase [Streptomyces sp. CWNU-1]MCM2390954.1 histidine kinase [Streptomyces sp. CWNU-1]